MTSNNTKKPRASSFSDYRFPAASCEDVGVNTMIKLKKTTKNRYQYKMVALSNGRDSAQLLSDL